MPYLVLSHFAFSLCPLLNSPESAPPPPLWFFFLHAGCPWVQRQVMATLGARSQGNRSWTMSTKRALPCHPSSRKLHALLPVLKLVYHICCLRVVDSAHSQGKSNSSTKFGWCFPGLQGTCVHFVRPDVPFDIFFVARRIQPPTGEKAHPRPASLQPSDGFNILEDLHISRGPSLCANTVSFGTFPGFCELLVQYAKISSRLWGGGGVGVYFLKSVRKGRFKNVWVGG